MAERFARALYSGDASELTALLASDAGVWIDGGGREVASRRPVIGREAVVDLLTGIRRKAGKAIMLRDVSLTIENVNSEPAVVIRVDGKIESLFVVETDGTSISALRVIRNPDKLARLHRRSSTNENASDA